VRTRVKFCGCTSVSDAERAVDAGADAVGVIFAPESPRCVDLDTGYAIAAALPAFVTRVAVFVEPGAAQVHDLRAAGYLPQFSGNELWQTCEAFAAGPYVKVFHVGAQSAQYPDAFEAWARGYSNATWMFETAVPGKSGGTGQTFEWEAARRLAGNRRIVISGGLTPENVGDCIRRVRPYAVDVRSGIETDGVKDRTKMDAFMRAVRDADARLARV